MRRFGMIFVLGWAACDGPSDDVGTDGGDDGGTDTDTTDTDTPGDTDTDTTPPGPGCFADWAFDLGDDGTIETTGIDEYDDANHDLLVYEERHYPAGTALMLEDYATTYTYDGNGFVVLVEQDFGIDGDVDVEQSVSWDVSGNLLTYAIDDDGDGVTDYAVELVYAGGLAVEMLEDLDGDGTTDMWWTFTYDGEGRLILLEGDLGDDGTIDSVETRMYTDPYLEVGVALIDFDNDGSTDLGIEFVYDALGNLLVEKRDNDADGTPETVYAGFYDDTTGLLTDEELKVDLYDPYVFILNDHYTHDAMGRRTEHVFVLEVLQPSMFQLPPERASWTFGGDCP